MFNEKEYEYINGEKLEVWQTPKYLESKAKAIEMLKLDYGLTEADFWILMNKTKGGKVAYTGLIISHNGCLKINDKLCESGKGFRAECLSEPIPFEYNGQVGLRQIYREAQQYLWKDNGNSIENIGEGLYEVGEISNANLKNAYPFAMLLKRTFDRVVLKKSKLAYAGIYSEAEADEFKEPLEEVAEPSATDKQIKFIESRIDENKIDEFLARVGKANLKELTMQEASKLITEGKK